MVTPTDDGLQWYNNYASGLAPGPLDTIAVGTGTGTESPTATSLQSETDRWTTSDAIVEFIPADGDNTVVFAVIELTGGLEIGAGGTVSEIGVFTTATSPETLVWYEVTDPVPYPSGKKNRHIIPMDFDRLNS